MVVKGSEPPSFAVLGDYGPNLAGPDIKEPVRKDKLSLDENDFISSLDAKLKKLEEDERRREDGGKTKRGKRSSSLETRPLFITTVKTGIFLDPPPELAALLGYSRGTTCTSNSTASGKSSEELMYSYSSQPRVLNNHSKVKPKVNNQIQQHQQQQQPQPPANKRRSRRDLHNTNNNTNNVINNATNNNKKDEIQYGNIMHDRRVVRGPAFLHQNPVQTKAEESSAARQAEARRRMIARRKAQSQRVRALRYRLGSPPQVEGRKSQALQTHDYLEELYDNPAKSVETQTPCSMESPPTPPLERVSSGVEVATQVFPSELFDFDTEVEPLLEVLVGKTLEQSLTEVFEEDELAALKAEQRQLRERRELQLAEIQREEEAEARRQRQLEGRIFEEEEAALNQAETEERVAAAVLTSGYIVDLLPSVMQGLRDAGYLYEEVKQDMGGEFMDWLIKEVKTEMQRMVENKDLLTDMLREILASRAELYRALGEKAADKRGADDEEDLTPSEVTTVTEQPTEAEMEGTELKTEEEEDQQVT